MLRSLVLGVLSASGRRDVGDLDLLDRLSITLRSTLPLSLRSSPGLQLSFISSAIASRAGGCSFGCGVGGIIEAMSMILLKWRASLGLARIESMDWH